MKFTFFTNCISPHQLPLAKQLINVLGTEQYRYIYTDALTEERQRMGWGDAVDARWCQQGDTSHKALQEVDVVMSGVRALDLFKTRLKEGKTTLYCSERWFKPPLGFLRVFVPSYLKMALRFVWCFRSEAFTYLPMGIHAARDMARLVGFLNGDVRYLFRAPKVAFESRPGGAIVPLKEAIKAGVLSKEEIAFGKKYGFVQISREHWGKVKLQKVYAKMRMWGYFVEPSSGNKTTEYTEYTEGGCAKDCQVGRNHEIHEMHEKGPTGRTASVKESTEHTESTELTTNCTNSLEKSEATQQQTANSKQLTDAPRLRVLWVGRMLDWKRVDTLVKACVSDALKDKVELHLYGHGPEEETLKRLAEVGNNVFFHDFVPVAQVRELMRAHDVYVLPSDGGEGWGAVVSEALEEGMKVLGTTGAGSSATILPPTHLFKAGDVDRLIELLSKEVEHISIGEWTAKRGAEWLTTK
jgi:glycosyltransferase involved in cell wall biosynthesis